MLLPHNEKNSILLSLLLAYFTFTSYSLVCFIFLPQSDVTQLKSLVLSLLQLGLKCVFVYECYVSLNWPCECAENESYSN